MGRKVKIGLVSVFFVALYTIIVLILWHVIKGSDVVSAIALIVSFSALYIVSIERGYKMVSVWIGFDRPELMPLFYLDPNIRDRCLFGLINEGESKSKSANIRYLIDGKSSDLIPVIPKAGGHVYYPGVTRGTWKLPKDFLLPSQKKIIFSVETKTSTFPCQTYCTGRTFSINGHEWIPILNKDRCTEPYFWKFKRCKNCPFEKQVTTHH